MTTVPSVEQSTVNVTDVPEATEAAIVEQLAVPLAFTKSEIAIPVTEALKSTVYERVREDEVEDGIETCAWTTTELMVTVEVVTAVTGPVFVPSVTELALRRSATVPSVVQVTTTLIVVPEAADTEVTEHVAVPEALTKSEAWISETASENVATKVSVREKLVIPLEPTRVAVGGTTSTKPPVVAENACEGSPAPLALTALISTG